MADCSKTEVFFVEWERMCEISYELQKALEIVQKWIDEHPRKTRQSEFLKIFPNARLDDKGILDLCPQLIDDTIFCDSISHNCPKCAEEYWLAEVE